MITDINSSKFPSNLDDDNTLAYIVPGETEVSALHLNQLRSSIFAIERALGTNPGAGMTVSQRLSLLTKEASELFRGILHYSLVFGYDRNGFAARAIFGENCESWIVYDGNEKEVSGWPDTGRRADQIRCAMVPDPEATTVPLSIVGKKATNNQGSLDRSIRMYDNVDIACSLRLEKDTSVQPEAFRGILDAPWGMMTRGRHNIYQPYDPVYCRPSAAAATSCQSDETDGMFLDLWVDNEIITIGDARFVNTYGDCMTGDLCLSFFPQESTSSNENLGVYGDGYGYGEEYGYGDGYQTFGVSTFRKPVAILFGDCPIPPENGMCPVNGVYPSAEVSADSAFMMYDADLTRSADFGIQSKDTFEFFVHENTGQGGVIRPLTIGGSMNNSSRRLKLIDDIDVAGSGRVGKYMYVGNNQSVNTQPNLTQYDGDNLPAGLYIYNGFLAGLGTPVDTVHYEQGYVGSGVTFGHRPGHTHAMADILNFKLEGPKEIIIHDTYDTVVTQGPRCDRDGSEGRALVNSGLLGSNMKIHAKNIHFDAAEGLYPILTLMDRNSNNSYIHTTRNGSSDSQTGITTLEFDLDSRVPTGEYNAILDDTTGLRGYSLFSSGGGLDVVDAIVVDIIGPSGTSLYLNVEYMFEATVTGGKPAYRYTWDFGDGSTSSLARPKHTYTDTDLTSVTVRLIINDSNEFSCYDTNEFTIGPSDCPTTIGVTWHIN